jgi:PAS domain-containing protein
VGAERGADEASFEALRQQHHLILRAAGEGIYGLDLEGRASFVNPAAAAMTGHSVDELLGQVMHDAVHHSHADGSGYPRSECPIYAAFKEDALGTID